MKFITIPVTPFEQNCSIVWCEKTKECAIIDPGGNVPNLITIITKNDLQPRAIYLTHAHLDHVGGTSELAAHFQITVFGPHQHDEYWLDALPKQAQMFGFPDCEIFKPDSWLQHGDTLELGEETFEVRLTPGHTPGHIVLYNDKASVVFVGDVLFHGSVGRSDFPGGNHADLMASIKNQLWTLDDDVIVVPGHGPNTTIGVERSTNPYVR